MNLSLLKNKSTGALLVVFMLLLFWFIFSAIKIWNEKKEYGTPDLRNRVVGSRILKHKTNTSPYFYKWKKQDGEIYLDPYDTPDLVMNRNTVTPFMLQILLPVCDLTYNRLSFLWYVAEIIAFLTAVIIIVSQSKSWENRILLMCVALSGIGISQGWVLHNLSGQVYIFISLLLAIIFYFSQKNSWQFELAAGFVLAALILIRPNAAVFVLPFIIRARWKVITFFAVSLTLYFAYVSISGTMWVWKDYFNAMNLWYQECINQHSTNNYISILNTSELEHSKAILQPPQLIYLEDTSIINAASRFMHIHLTRIHLLILMLVSFLIGGLYYYKKIRTIDLNKLIVFAFVLYFISELCIPAIRNSYNAVQWVLPITIIILNRKISTLSAALLVAGSILGTGILKFLPYDLFMSELIFLLACLIFLTQNNPLPENRGSLHDSNQADLNDA